MRSILFGLIAAAVLASPAAAQPAAVTFDFERTDLGVWSAPAGRISDYMLMLGTPLHREGAEPQFWFWHRNQGLLSLDIPRDAEGAERSACATNGAVVWLEGERRGNGYRSYLRRMPHVGGMFRLNRQRLFVVDAPSDMVGNSYTAPVTQENPPERAIYFARGGCRLISTNTFQDVIRRSPSLARGSHVQFTTLENSGWRASPMQERRLAPNAVTIEWFEGQPYVEFDRNFAVVHEGAGGAYDGGFQTALGHYGFNPEARMAGVQLPDGRLWRAALSYPTADGCIVLQASQHGSAVMVSGPFSTSFPYYRYHVIDLCSPANQAIAAAPQ